MLIYDMCLPTFHETRSVTFLRISATDLKPVTVDSSARQRQIVAYLAFISETARFTLDHPQLCSDLDLVFDLSSYLTENIISIVRTRTCILIWGFSYLSDFQQIYDKFK